MASSKRNRWVLRKSLTYPNGGTVFQAWFVLLVQCWSSRGRQPGKCWCVDGNGMPLPSNTTQKRSICGLLNASKINISTEVLSATQRKMRECHTDMDMHRSTGLNKRMLNMYHSRKTQAAALHPLLNTPPHIYVIFSIGIFFMIIMLHNVNGKAVRITCFDHCTVIFIVFLCCYLIFRIIFKIVYTYCVVWSLTKSALSR